MTLPQMTKFKEFLLNNAYGLLILGIIILYMLSHPQRTLDVDCICSFTIDYRTGFGGRKLIASIVSFFISNFNLSRLLKIVYLITIIGCVFFAYCCNLFIRKTNRLGENYRLASIYLLTLYMMCPASLFFLLVFPNFGRLDFFLYLSCLLFCILFYHRKENRPIYFLCVATLIVINILSHHIFVATYLSFFVALFIYDIWEKGFNKNLFSCYFVLALITVATFLSIFLFSSMKISLEEATQYHPNLELSKKFVWFIYYAHIADHFNLYVLSNAKKLLAIFILTILFLLPLFIFGRKIWKITIDAQDKYSRNLFWGMQSAFLLFIPAFCITVDYARWFAAFIFIQFLLIAYFMFDKDSLYSNIGESLGLYVKKHTYYCAFLIIYCSLLGYFGSDRTFECGEFILEKMHIYKSIVQLPAEILQ